MSKSIGIDLGTTYSCVAVWQDNRAEVIQNDQGNRTTPSIVAFNDSERLVGEAARNQAARNPKNTVFGVKRMIGRRFNDTELGSDMRHWPFKVVDRDEKPAVQVKYEDEYRIFTPEELSSMILIKMKETAAAYLGTSIDSAVITVPAYFSDSQRQATKDAGRIAGLNVRRVINEPTAAAIAYGLSKKTAGSENVLVIDLGGGTFDVSLLNIDSGIFEVKATSGDMHLGGEDFDNCLVDYLLAKFKSKYNKDISNDPRAIRRLRTSCERAKRALSFTSQTVVEVDSLHNGIDFYTTLTRAHFEELCRDLFKKIIKPIELVLSDAKLDKDLIDEIVLVGGSTRIPKIQKMVADMFNGKELNKTVNPEEAVAYGAAVHASILSGNTSEKTESLILVDVAPLSLGTGIAGDLMSTVITRNTAIPVTKSEIYYTGCDNQTEVLIDVYEGERSQIKDNNLLGAFLLCGIPPRLRGQAKIEVTFDIDANGILTVYAVEKSTGKMGEVTIEHHGRGCLSKDEIERMVNDAEKCRNEDKAARARIEARNKLESCAYRLRHLIQDERVASCISSSYKEKLKIGIKKVFSWIKTHQEAGKAEYESRQKHLEDIASCMVKTFHICSDASSISGFEIEENE